MSDRRAATTPAPAPEATEAPPPERRPGAELEDIAEASSVDASAPRREAGLAIGRALRLDGDVVDVDLAGRVAQASMDRSVHRSVVETACARGEMLLLTGEGASLRVVGALRTQPTPGVDAMDEITLEARRVTLVGGEEVQLRSGVAVVALRAIGEVETYADRIISRAEELQKIVGRMLRLN